MTRREIGMKEVEMRALVGALERSEALLEYRPDHSPRPYSKVSVRLARHKGCVCEVLGSHPFISL